MNETLQALEEGRVKERMPITYAIMKNPSIMGELLAWLEWYPCLNPEPSLSAGDAHFVRAKLGWEKDEATDPVMARCAQEIIAQNVANSHNLILENVQRADFAKGAA